MRAMAKEVDDFRNGSAGGTAVTASAGPARTLAMTLRAGTGRRARVTSTAP